MLPATSEAEKVRFHALNRVTGNRVHSQYVEAETGKPVADEDQVKGYEREDGEYVLLEDEELEAVTLESTRTIDIDCFVPSDSIGWIQLADGVPSARQITCRFRRCCVHDDPEVSARGEG